MQIKEGLDEVISLPDEDPALVERMFHFKCGHGCTGEESAVDTVTCSADNGVERLVINAHVYALAEKKQDQLSGNSCYPETRECG